MKMRKWHFLITGHYKRKDCWKFFINLTHPLLMNILWSFSDEKYFLQDHIVNTQNHSRLALHREIYWYWWKTNTQSTSWFLEWSLAMDDAMALFIFTHDFRFNTESYIKGWDQEGGFWMTVCLVTGLCNMPHKLAENFFDYITPNNWLPKSLDYNPFDN